MWCKLLDWLQMFIMERKNSSHQRKSAFPPYVTLYDETKWQFGCGYLQTAQASVANWYIYTQCILDFPVPD